MKAAQITGPKRFDVIEADMPKVNDGQCLIRLECWSVCGSDIRHGYGPVLPEEQYPMRVGAPCHECAGTIVESRTDEFKEGQRVIVLPSRTSTGGLVEYLAGDPGRMALLPDDGDLADWVMCQPSGTVLFSCQQMGTILGKDVLIIGQGGIGLSFTAICARAGARKVIVADLFDNRLKMAKKFGATHTINPSKEKLDETVEEITGGAMPDISVEAGGYPDTFNAALRLIKQFGTVIVFGIPEFDTFPLEWRGTGLLRKQPRIIPTQGAATPDPITQIRTMIELKARGWWNPGEMVTHVMDFDDVKKAYDYYENRTDGAIKVVLKP